MDAAKGNRSQNVIKEHFPEHLPESIGHLPQSATAPQPLPGPQLSIPEDAPTCRGVAKITEDWSSPPNTPGPKHLEDWSKKRMPAEHNHSKRGTTEAGTC